MEKKNTSLHAMGHKDVFFEHEKPRLSFFPYEADNRLSQLTDINDLVN